VACLELEGTAACTLACGTAALGRRCAAPVGPPGYVRPAPLISLTNSLSLESPLRARPWGRTDGRPAAWEREVVVVAAVGGVRSAGA
jgi:hypothetical protein